MVLIFNNSLQAVLTSTTSGVNMINDKSDLNYRQVFTLKDGGRVLVRPLAVDDRQSFYDLFLNTSNEDRRYMRHDVGNTAVLDNWIDHNDPDHVLPLVAIVGNRLVGVASLHFNDGPARHRAEVRIFLNKEFRSLGVGSRVLQGLIETARRRGLYLLEVEIVSDQAHLIKAFRNLGFETRAVFEDYFMMPDGELRDVAHMVLRLRSNDQEF